MANINVYKTICLDQQTELHRLLTEEKDPQKGQQLFFSQHARLHSQRMAQCEDWSFQDAILDGLREAEFRTQPANSEHSIAWLIWHISRCEDIAMNMLIAGSPQVLLSGDWNARLKTELRDTGNLMQAQELVDFNATIAIDALLEYREAVGQRTRTIVQNLQPQDLNVKVDPERIARVLAQGAVLPATQGITDYWGKRTYAGLLLMPASRHLLTHLNEAIKIRERMFKYCS